MSADDIERLDNASMNILENVGIQFRDTIALDDWRRAGAKIIDEVVYPDRDSFAIWWRAYPLNLPIRHVIRRKI